MMWRSAHCTFNLKLMLYDFDGLHLHSTGNILMFYHLGLFLKLISLLTKIRNVMYIEKEEAIGGA